MLPTVTTLSDPLVKPLGKRAGDTFEKVLGFRTVGDLLRHYPRRYYTRGELTPLDSLHEGDHVTVLAMVELVASHDWRGGHSPAQLAVMVRNNSGQALTPRFAIDTSGPMSPFWRRVRGPTELAPGSTARYIIGSPHQGAGPHPGSTYVLQAVTMAPRTISS